MRVAEGYLAQRKEEIASVAMKMYCEKGPNVSMAAICDAAGIAKGTIFRYYPTREQMFREIFDACRQHARELEEALPPAPQGADSEHIIKHAIKGSFTWPVSYPLEFQFLTMYTDANVFFVFEPHSFDDLSMNALDDPKYSSAFDKMKRPGLPDNLAKRMLSSLVNTCSRFLISNPELRCTKFLDEVVDSIYASVFLPKSICQ